MSDCEEASFIVFVFGDERLDLSAGFDSAGGSLGRVVFGFGSVSDADGVVVAGEVGGKRQLGGFVA